MLINRRKIIQLLIGFSTLPLYSCKDNKNMEMEYKEMLSTIQVDSLIGVFILLKLNKVTIINKKDLMIKDACLYELLDQMLIWNQFNNKRKFINSLNERISKDFTEDKTMLLRNILFSNTEIQIFHLLNKYKVAINLKN